MVNFVLIYLKHNSGGPTPLSVLRSSSSTPTDTPADKLRYSTNDRDATTVHRPYPTMADIHPV